MAYQAPDMTVTNWGEGGLCGELYWPTGICMKAVLVEFVTVMLYDSATGALSPV